MLVRIGLAFALLTCCIGYTNSAKAQTLNRVQPIILEASSSCCSSPAATATASELVCLPCGDSTYLRPQDRDPLRVVPVSSQLKPLPTVQAYRGYDTSCNSMTGCSAPVTMLPPANTATVQVMRPATCDACVTPAPTVPEGYVVGKGLVGQPKLYRPGQPVRNFLRYITL